MSDVKRLIYFFLYSLFQLFEIVFHLLSSSEPLYWMTLMLDLIPGVWRGLNRWRLWYFMTGVSSMSLPACDM